MFPKRESSNRERYAGGNAAVPGERPAQSTADIVHLSPVLGEPLGRRPDFPFRLGAFGEFEEMFGVALAQAVAFAALGKFLQRIFAGCIEQSVVRPKLSSLRRYKRLRNEVRDTVNASGAGTTLVDCNGAGRFETEGACKDREPSQQDALRLGEQAIAPAAKVWWRGSPLRLSLNT
ncbi:hypothetical protein [Rhizobium leguminosarum]|uniref:hypothetical protein n=1 Tax=Rhizobium leguminosarum TaxID=384 RepID=UPI0021BBE020|nr:hypothetical protein [Rhizobium leguminosarum]